MRTRTIFAADGSVKAEFVNGECTFYAGDTETRTDAPMVIPDLQPFVANTGEYIGSRRAWRQHLQQVGGIEMGASDLKAQERQWAQRKAEHRERIARAEGVVKAMPMGDARGPIRPQQMSRLNVEIANRLHGRPEPGRKELIKLTLDTAKRMKLR